MFAPQIPHTSNRKGLDTMQMFVSLDQDRNQLEIRINGKLQNGIDYEPEDVFNVFEQLYYELRDCAVLIDSIYSSTVCFFATLK
jgi:hypothetical protein